MKRTIHHILLAGILAMACVSCGEETGNETTTTYTPANAEITSPTTWKATDEILVDCILKVSSTLTIEPGSVVRFTGNGYLRVGENSNGAIIANGTAEKPIRFTHNQGDLTTIVHKGSWYGLYFGERNLVNTTKLKHCLFDGAGKENTPCIEFEKTTLNLSSCTISDCAAIGIKAGQSAEFSAFSQNTLSQCDGFLLSGVPGALLNLDTTNTFTPTNNKGIAITGGYLEFDGTLTKQAIPYTITGNIFLENATLTIEKGSTLAFNDRTALIVGKETRAALIAVGTSTEPILFTSASSNPIPGSWEGLVFYQNTQSTVTNLKYVTIDYAGQSVGTLEGAISTFSPINITNSTIKNSSSYGIYCIEGVGIANFKNNTVQTCNKYPVSIHVNQANTLDSTNIFTNNAYNAIKLRGAILNGNVRWRKLTAPYLIEESLAIGNGTTSSQLTLAAGCTLQFSVSASLTVNRLGSLVARGTAQDSIRFTSASETPAAGDWIGLYFDLGSSGNILNYCSISYAGDFSEYAVGINTSGVSIVNSRIQHSLKHGLYIYYNELENRPFLISNAYNDIPGSNIYYEPAP